MILKSLYAGNHTHREDPLCMIPKSLCARHHREDPVCMIPKSLCERHHREDPMCMIPSLCVQGTTEKTLCA